MSIKIRSSWIDNNTHSLGVRVYRKLEVFTKDTLPDVYATIPKGTSSYEDTNVEEDQTYFYMLGVFNNGQEVFTECYPVDTTLTPSDPNAAFLTNHLNFEASNLFDKKTGSNWSAVGSVSYVPVSDKIALSISKPSYILTPETLFSANSFTAIFDITFLNDPTFPHQAIMSLRANSSPESIDIFRLNGSGIAAYKGAYGIVGSGVNLPNNVRLLLKIVKKSDNTIKFFINDVLMSTQNFPYDVSSGSRILIGRNNADEGRGLNAIIHEFRYYHGKEID